MASAQRGPPPRLFMFAACTCPPGPSAACRHHSHAWYMSRAPPRQDGSQPPQLHRRPTSQPQSECRAPTRAQRPKLAPLFPPKRGGGRQSNVLHSVMCACHAAPPPAPTPTCRRSCYHLRGGVLLLNTHCLIGVPLAFTPAALPPNHDLPAASQVRTVVGNTAIALAGPPPPPPCRHAFVALAAGFARQA